MKRVLLFLVISVLATVAFSQKKETRQVSGFTGINASSVFEITVSKGSSESLTIEAEAEVLPYIHSEVKNGVLNLYLDNNKLRNIKSIKATVVMRNFESVSLSGACKLKANDLFTPDKFKIECSGASNMDVNIDTKQLNIEASGACKIGLKANVTGITNMEVSGASKIFGDLRAENVNFSSSGASSIELKGSANDFKIDVSGTSKVLAGDFIVKTSSVKSSGVSKVTVNATNTLKVNSSGTSSVEYKGSPTLELNKNQVSKVRNI